MSVSAGGINGFCHSWLPSFGVRKPCCHRKEKTTLFGYDVVYIQKTLREDLNVLTVITATTEAFHSIAKFMVCLAAALKPMIFLGDLQKTFLKVDTWIDGLRIVKDVKNMISLKFVKDFHQGRFCEIASDASFVIANSLATVSLLGFFKMINLDKVALALGRTTLPGFKNPSLESDFVVNIVALQFQTLAFFFMGIQTALDIAQGDHTKQKMLLLITCIWEVVSKSFLFLCGAAVLETSTTAIVAAGVLGMIANGFGTWSAYEDEQQAVIRAKRAKV